MNKNKIIKENKNKLKMIDNYSLYYKLNGSKNYLVINKFFFESDLFKNKKEVKKYCNKVNKLIFNNLYHRLNIKNKIKTLLFKLSKKINEKIFLRTKILRYKNIFLYLHLNKNLCVLKVRKDLNFKDLVLNVFFYKTRNLNKLSNINSLFNKKKIKYDDNFNYLKKIYFF